MSTLKTIVVDDYQPAVEQLVQTITTTCPQVHVLDNFPVAQESLKKINEVAPDLVFFDVTNTNRNPFALLNSWQKSETLNLVLTAQESFFSTNSLSITVSDILNKPVCPEKLTNVVNKVSLECRFQQLNGKFNELEQTVRAYVEPKLAIPTLHGLEYVDTEQIVYIEAADNYAVFYLTNNQQVVSSQSLLKLQKKLFYLPFIRIHRSFLVNKNHIRKYIKGDGGQVMMSNQKYLNVARNRKESLIANLTS